MTELTNHNQAEKLLSGLNKVQREAVLHDQGPLLILAGAGSGKTRVITHRIAYLVQVRGVHPAEILAITFTNKAAREMQERIAGLIGLVAGSMWVGTFHSMMLRILRRHADLIGFSANFTILDVADQQRMIKEVYKELGLDEKMMTVRSCLNLISNAKNKMQSWQEVEAAADNSEFTAQVARVYRAYQEKMQVNNAMDFDDILCYSVELLRQNPAVLEAYQNRFKYVLVDEYQDTNHVQYLLVKLLSGKYKNLCVVGDDDQSIYAFRGANIQNILDFEKDFSRSKVIKLEQNYRSTGNILAAANAVIKQNEGRTDKKLWTDQPAGDRLIFYQANDHYDEARFVAKEIKRLTGRPHHPVSLSEVAVLYRVNALSRNIEFALREAGINYSIYGGLRFYDRKEVKDLLAYLRLIYSPADDLAFQRAISNPKRGIGQISLDRISQLASREGLSMFELTCRAQHHPDLSRVAYRLQAFAEIINDLRSVMLDNKLGFKEFIGLVQEKSGLLADLVALQAKEPEEAAGRLENLRELLSDALEFEAQLRSELANLANLDYESEGIDFDLTEDQSIQSLDDLTLEQMTCNFLERSALYSDQDQDQSRESVRLMAIHSAKGLEFDLVFLIGAEEGIFPGYRSLESQTELEEERRLAYVAITRARQKLYITASNSRLIYGQTKYNVLSRFVSEIPAENIEELGASSRSNVFGQPGKGLEASQNLSYASGAPGKASKFLAGFSHKQEPTITRTEQLDLDQLKAGDKLIHSKFGEGRLERIDRVGQDAILTIDFSGRVKRLMANSAPLRPADKD